MWAEEMERSRSGLAFRRGGSGPAVVLLHGIPGNAASWRETADVLSDAGDVIVPDLLGFGASARPTGIDELHAASQATAVESLLDELNVPQATVVGHDFGGPVALALVARRPTAVTSLGLLATNTFTDTPVPFPLSAVVWPLIGPLARRVLFSRPSLAMMLRRGVGKRIAAIDASSSLGDRAQQQAIATIFSASLTRLAELYQPIEDQLHELDVPVFVGWGDHDPFFSVEQGERTAHAAGTSLRLYRGAGHFLPQERPRDVAQDIAALVTAAVA